MIEPDPSMFLYSALSDDELIAILDTYGPHVKDSFLIPMPDEVLPCSLTGS
jgi:hypothetical protein